ncbi:hypothetical protein ACJIZ3_006573 [Penstemon smallii]|uniref:Uncharacterized protein n=1 Tax=Penstemon smallii TaxID=265156 RepID=A0ABD3S8A4_9LAMI
MLVKIANAYVIPKDEAIREQLYYAIAPGGSCTSTSSFKIFIFQLILFNLNIFNFSMSHFWSSCRCAISDSSVHLSLNMMNKGIH